MGVLNFFAWLVKIFRFVSILEYEKGEAAMLIIISGFCKLNSFIGDILYILFLPKSLSDGSCSHKSSQIVKAIFFPLKFTTLNLVLDSKYRYSSNMSYVGRRVLFALKIICPSDNR
ncbi:hypothetical protein ES708_19639 [subsurface metagenome]